MSLELVLTCDECGKTEQPRVYHRWAPWGVLELTAAADFYVDGKSVRCPEHTDAHKLASQRRARELVRMTA